jgi:acyl carrier protein
MNMDQKLAALLADIFNMRPTEIVPGLTKSDVGSWDSLKQMDLVVTLEREYGISLEISDIVSMVSVTAIVNVLKNKGAALGD